MIRFFVPGRPAPGGSKIVGMTKAGKTYVRPASKHVELWRKDVVKAALKHHSEHYDVKPWYEGNVKVTCTFHLKRPRAHYNSKGEIKPQFLYELPGVMPDLTKLWRSTEDALKGIAWVDDARVVESHLYKGYGELTGALITLEAIA